MNKRTNIGKYIKTKRKEKKKLGDGESEKKADKTKEK
jgi:hypothetical protein